MSNPGWRLPEHKIIHGWAERLVRQCLQSRNYSLRLALGFVALTSAAVACGPSVNLSNVSTFAALANSAQTASDDMAASLYQDCVAAREYGDLSGLAAAPDSTPSSLSSLPIIGTEPPSPTPAPSTTDSDSAHEATQQNQTTHQAGVSVPPGMQKILPPNDSTCSGDLLDSQWWQAFNDGIFAYVKGLGAVAGVSVTLNSSDFATPAANLAKLGIIKNATVASDAGNFVAAVGTEILKHKQDHDIAVLVQASQKNGVFNKMLSAAEAADIAYYGAIDVDKMVVDNYFASLIDVERRDLTKLTKASQALRDSAPSPVALGPPPSTLPENTKKVLTATCRNCATNVNLQAQIGELRDKIAVQRGRWTTLDAKMLIDLNRVQPFYSTMVDLGRANDALVKPPRPGVAGYVDAISPVIDDLSSSVVALVTAAIPTPKPAPTPTPKKK